MPLSRTLRALLVLACLGMIAGIAISLPVWLHERTFPLVPLFARGPIIPSWGTIAILGCAVGSTCFAMFARDPRVALIGTIACVLLLGSADQMRWQPWMYQYLLIFGILAFHSWDQQDARSQRATVNAIGLLLIATYVYSGLQKLDVNFVRNVFPWFVEPFAPWAPAWIGWSIPVLELCIGLGLTIGALRRAAVIGATLMHFSILLLLGPLGHNWNAVVWPWNIVMVVMVWTIFWSKEYPWRAWGQHAMQWFLVALGCVVPALSFAGMWDTYLSHGLYGANVTRADVEIASAVAAQLSADVRKHLVQRNGNRYAIDVSGWAMDELHVPPYPERRVYKHLAKTFCAIATSDDDVRIAISLRSPLFGRRETQTFNCSTL